MSGRAEKKDCIRQSGKRHRKLGVEDKICFAGKQENVRRYLSAMDVFLFPSLFEGVPFALIEAQTNGLACVMSDAVSEEAVVFPEAVKRLPLQEENRVWADTLLEMSRLKENGCRFHKTASGRSSF